VVEFCGRYTIGSPPPGIRPPGRTAREVMLAAEADVRRWNRAFQEIEAAPVRPTFFALLFTAVGRRPRLNGTICDSSVDLRGPAIHGPYTARREGTHAARQQAIVMASGRRRADEPQLRIVRP
jgi:hypothetical protein